MYQIRHVLLTLLMSLSAFAFAPALAQSNPPLAACGLPAAGELASSVSYTLTGDCQQTGVLTIPSGLTVTIDGAGHTISAAADERVIETAGQTTIRDVVITGGDYALVANAGSTLLVEDTVFRQNNSAVVIVDYKRSWKMCISWTMKRSARQILLLLAPSKSCRAAR